MKLSIYLGCSILLFLSPICLGYTIQAAEFDLREVSQLMTDSQSIQTKMKNIHYLMLIYDLVAKYMPADERQRLNRLVAENTTPIDNSKKLDQLDLSSFYVTDEEQIRRVAFFDELAGTLKNWLVEKVKELKTAQHN